MGQITWSSPKLLRQTSEHLEGKKYQKEHYGHSQPYPLIQQWWVDAYGLLVSVAWASFVINVRAAPAPGLHCWCCLTLNLIACSGKAKCFLKVSHTRRQTGSAFNLWPRPKVRVLFFFFLPLSSVNRSRNPQVHTPSGRNIKKITTISFPTSYCGLLLGLTFLFAELLLFY